METEGPHAEQEQVGRDNVIRLPRDWLGPREELVPFGPRADEGAPPPSAADFWGEGSAAVQDALQVPVTSMSADGDGLSVSRPSRVRGSWKSRVRGSWKPPRRWSYPISQPLRLAQPARRRLAAIACAACAAALLIPGVVVLGYQTAGVTPPLAEPAVASLGNGLFAGSRSLSRAVAELDRVALTRIRTEAPARHPAGQRGPAMHATHPAAPATARAQFGAAASGPATPVSIGVGTLEAAGPQVTSGASTDTGWRAGTGGGGTTSAGSSGGGSAGTSASGPTGPGAAFGPGKLN